MSVSQQLFFCEAKNRARLGGAVGKIMQQDRRQPFLQLIVDHGTIPADQPDRCRFDIRWVLIPAD